MSRHSTLPDFHKLCEPAQNHIWDIINLEIFFFFLTSMGGFLWEVLIFLVKEHHFYNRGFFYGPWLPVYGIGAVLLSLCIQCTPLAKKKTPINVFFFSLVLGTIIELLVGWMLDFLWQLRYWDYSDYFLNFKGYICFISAIGFGIAGVLWICVLAPFFQKIYKKIPVPLRYLLNTLLILAFLFDSAASFIFPNTGTGITF